MAYDLPPFTVGAHLQLASVDARVDEALAEGSARFQIQVFSAAHLVMSFHVFANTSVDGREPVRYKYPAKGRIHRD